MSSNLRWHLIQHGFVDEHSHFATEARCWQQAMAGKDWIGYAHLSLPAALAQELQLLPCFPLKADAALDPDPISREVGDYLTFSGAFASHCAKFVTPRLSGDDVVLVTYSTQRELLGAALWLRAIEAARRPRMVFVFHLPDLQWTISEDRRSIQGSLSTWRHAANELAAVLPASHRLIAATTPRLAQGLSQVLNQPVQTAPLVLSSPESARSAEPRDLFDVILCGESRWEKGAEMYAPLLLQLAQWRPGLRFSVQTRSEQEGRQLATQLQAQGFAGQLELVYGAVSPAEHARRLSASRLALLPYQPQRYALRASGVAIECFMRGIPVVAPAGTGVADQLESGLGAGITFAAWDVASVLAATQEALLKIDELTVTARQNSVHWQGQIGAQPMLQRISELLHLG